MIRTRTICLVAWAIALSGVPRGRCANIIIVPVASDGVHTINAANNEIILPSGGQRITLEIFVDGWDPDLDGVPTLKGFQVVVDSSGYTNGVRGFLTPTLVPCSDDQTCIDAFGGVCSFLGDACTVDSDCPFVDVGETCEGSRCDFPILVGGFCEPGFMYGGRPDFIFPPTRNLAAVDLTALDFRFASTLLDPKDAIEDPGTRLYVGTLVLDVSSDAVGRYEVGLFPSPDSILLQVDNSIVQPLNARSALVLVPCQLNSDCADNSVCTTDVCAPDGTCVNTPNFDETVSCCDPGTGDLCGVPSLVPGDFDDDGRTDLSDFALLQRCFHADPPTGECANVDVSCNCSIDADDVAAFVAEIGVSR